MSALVVAPLPYPIGDEHEDEEHGDFLRAPSLGTSDEAIEELQQLDHVHSVRQAAPQQQLSLVLPGQTISRQMAYRVMRDAVALQLARRGFDGLRGTALWLVAELAADFTRALGYQLGQVVVPSPYTDASLLPLVRRLQRHTLLSSPAEWAHMSTIFSRSTNQEPLQGSVYSQVMQQQQPWRGGPPPPRAVQALYATMRGAWHYKQTGAGRAAHLLSGQADAPPNLDTKAPALIAHSLRLNRKQRQLADKWIFHCHSGMHSGLLPGVPVLEMQVTAELTAQKGRKRKADTKADKAAAAAAAAHAAAGGAGSTGLLSGGGGGAGGGGAGGGPGPLAQARVGAPGMPQPPSY